jgi:hypothetical protein
MEANAGGVAKSLIACMGHAVYQTRAESAKRGDEREWVGGFPGEDDLYYQHVKDATDLARIGKYDCLVLSGGTTRTKAGKPKDRIGKSEAQGMLDLGLSQKPAWFVKRSDDLYYVADTANTRVLLEEYARDSFENLLFCVLAFQKEFGAWPEGAVGVVSFQFKLLRYSVAATALDLHDFAFHGSGDVPFKTLKKCGREEADYVEKAVRDPLHRGPEFSTKRLKRTPTDKDYEQYWRDVTDYYSNGGSLGLVKQYLAELKELESRPVEPDVPWAPWHQ